MLLKRPAWSTPGKGREGEQRRWRSIGAHARMQERQKEERGRSRGAPAPPLVRRRWGARRRSSDALEASPAPRRGHLVLQRGRAGRAGRARSGARRGAGRWIQVVTLLKRRWLLVGRAWTQGTLLKRPHSFFKEGRRRSVPARAAEVTGGREEQRRCWGVAVCFPCNRRVGSGRARGEAGDVVTTLSMTSSRNAGLKAVGEKIIGFMHKRNCAQAFLPARQVQRFGAGSQKGPRDAGTNARDEKFVHASRNACATDPKIWREPEMAAGRRQKCPGVRNLNAGRIERGVAGRNERTVKFWGSTSRNGCGVDFF
ncbi:hypothetical protein B0H17DRAFT_1135199 [Mycena rosella]|uniref:Uncharacterized protein n=1 Tax=Mycena rosella TaxID=1033263 RepID=A0AAD7DED0_MYCRO|nr:hypothetical protein B0H17DRAFT_1135199 [Mycena rosella]